MKNSEISNFLFPMTSELLSSLKVDASLLSNSQLIWLSGYYWGKAHNNVKDNNSVETNIDKEMTEIVTVVSASQTGNAQDLSTIFFNELQLNNIQSRLVQACDYSFKKISKEQFLIIITSTQGEGEPPEESIAFYNFLKSSKAPDLKNLYFSVFGLGDSSYDLFCQAGKDFDNQLNKLGAQRLIDRVDADIEYSEIAKKWRTELINILKVKLNNRKINKNDFSITNIQHPLSIKTNQLITKENPYSGELLVNQKITGRDSVKDIRHIEIGVCNSKIQYQPGDSLGVWYENDSQLVIDILKIFNINRNESVIVNKHCMSIFIALSKYFELTVNTNHIVIQYAQITNNNNLKKIILDKKKLSFYSKNTSIVNMFYEYPCTLTAEQMIGFLRPLLPRFYSISSSQKLYNDEVHITVGVVQYFSANRLCQGGASSYLSYRISEDSKIRLFIQSNKNFRLPKDDKISIIMIGPGTGIAPFRAFMQERDYLKARGRNWLFYGNNTFTEDFLYQREWQNYFNKGLLTKIDLAWSRDTQEKIYVQYKLWEQGEEVWDWIVNGAYIYICGDKLNMAKDVESVLLKIFIKYGSMNEQDSYEYLNNLRINNRYQRDVY
ncbi:Sulfite reductase [NADPH] flavoprotein alpha-component [Buchnera aphidicola (Eriosoma lanigerum)]|uniref:assimilatory sulfite reductase (NADPH) flavoprotein subunit n=1 Tax=Buchnera aphidicola TaxID=9 RepID=UPI003463B8E8